MNGVRNGPFVEGTMRRMQVLGMLALLLAALMGCKASSKAALELKGFKFTPAEFCRAVKDGHEEAVKLFLKAGMNPNAGGAVCLAASDGLMPMLRILADGRANLGEACAEGAPILLAARAGHGDIVEYLAEKGVPLNEADSKGVTVLMYAAGRCDLTSLKALLARKADLSARDKRGWTAWTYAHEANQKDMADLLEKAGAQVYLDPDRESLLQYARELEPTFSGSVSGEETYEGRGLNRDIAEFKRLSLKICCQMDGNRDAVENYLAHRGFPMSALELRMYLWGNTPCGGCEPPQEPALAPTQSGGAMR